MDRIHQQIVLGIQEYCKKNHFTKAVIGLSGGVDSSLTLKLAVDAMQSHNVIGILMPELGLSSTENTLHAQKLAEFFDVKHYRVPINPYLVDYTHLPWASSDLAYANTKARVRMSLLYNYANSFRAIVLGTSNKSEILLGYGTKYGDLAADLEVLGDLYKTDVWRLADYLGLPPEIVNKAPTAELFSGQTDEKELGGSYQDLDNILRSMGMGFEKIVSKGMNPTLVRKTLTTVKKNEHKRSMAPIIQIRR